MQSFPTITNFTSGELSPRLEGRTDITKYYNGCRLLENFIVLPHGGATRRPGSYYAASVKTHTKKTRLIPFVFSSIQAYMIEVGDYYMRFYKDKGQILSGGSPYEISTPYALADIYDLKFVQSADTMYITHPSYLPRVLSRTGHTSWTLKIKNAKAAAAKTITGATKADPCKITCVGHGMVTGDVVFIEAVEGMTEVNDRVYTITKTGDDDFTLDGVDSTSYTTYTTGGTANLYRFPSSSYYPEAVTFFEERLVFARDLTVTLSKSADYNDFVLGTNDDDSCEYTLLSDKVNLIKWMCAQDYILIGTQGGEWRLGGSSVSDPITPSSVNAKRQSTYGSKGLQGLMVNDIVVYVQKMGRKIREMAYNLQKDGFVSNDLTILSEHATKSGIVSYDYQQQPDSIIWAAREDGILISMTYERAHEVVGFARHPSRDGDMIESVAVIPGSGEDEIWISTARVINGSVKRYVEYLQPRDFGSDMFEAFFVDCGLTFDGGDFYGITGITQADPAVVTCTGHPFTNGQTVRLTDIEGMTELNTLADGVFTVANAATDTFELLNVDSTGFGAYTTGGWAQRVVNAVSGLSHLEGEAVSILVDGEAHADGVVSSGSVTLDSYYNYVHVGLPFTSKLKPMKLEAGQTKGTSQGRIKYVDSATVRLYETIGGQVGPDEDNLHYIPFDDESELYSGDKEINLDARNEAEGDIMIVQSQPLPMTVLSIMPRVTTYED